MSRQPNSVHGGSCPLPTVLYLVFGQTLRLLSFLVLTSLFAFQTFAQNSGLCTLIDGAPTIRRDTLLGESGSADLLCSNQYHCPPPQQRSSPAFRYATPGCDPLVGACTVDLVVPLDFPHNHLNTFLFSQALIYWFEGAPPVNCNPTNTTGCGYLAVCGLGGGINTDFVDTYVRLSVSCGTVLSVEPKTYSVRGYACGNVTTCQDDIEVTGLEVNPQALAAFLGCPIPREDECDQCTASQWLGDGGTSFAGPSCAIGDGPGARLRYAAGGAGGDGLPGALEWQETLGRYWSHDYAQRIVLDPDDSHVWLITEHATFRQFGNLSGGVYQTISPSDEYRTLHRTAGGWEFHDLDGTVMAFDSAGLWLSTTDRNGNAKVASYVADRLDSVSFPDGRREELTYGGDGKLASIAEIGVDNVTTREWIYTWSGDDLTRIDRPDGTAHEYFYEDAQHPSYLTRIDLVGTDGTSRRVESAWEYDADGNVVKMWRGDEAHDGPDAVDLWQWSFDDPQNPTQAFVTDPLDTAPATYTLDRDPAGQKVRVRQIDGDCPSCGLGPNTVLSYEDPANPLLPTREVDGNGHVTEMAYDAHGRMTSRTEAVGEPEERTSTWEYDPTYPALVTKIIRPSVQSGAERVTLFTRDASGNVTSQEIRGYEDGLPFDCTVAGAPCYETGMTYTSTGQVETVDPPGYGTGDVTTYVYDPARGSLVLDHRIDPLIGTTDFDHDAFNRRTDTTDPNGVTVKTSYDPLNRVTEIRHLGATPAEDLVTVHEHTVFGDLFRTLLPEGNVIEYGYDPAGRLVTIERKPDATTPGERTVFRLDASGNRTKETLERWNGTEWVQDSTTTYLYKTRCHLDQVLTPDGAVTELAYDCNGNLERTWDGNHPSNLQTAEPSATYVYDPLDRLESVIRPWAGAGGGQSVTLYDYDVQDHLVGVEDAEGNLTTYTYSDRDLMTEEISPVSGTTTHRYNEHGELVETTDARGVVEVRAVDALDRVTAVDYPTDSLDVVFTYDDPAVPFSVGRLTAITRDGHSVDYRYDRFGRTTRDGELTFDHDRNGNRTEIGYPDGVTAVYGHDFADRERTLEVTSPSGTLPVVTSAGYLSSGPLSSLAFATGVTETRSFTSRYFPDEILLGAIDDRAWDYGVDLVGNIRHIEETVNCTGDLILDTGTVTGTEVQVSCAGIEAGDGYSVGATGDLTLTAATRVTLKSGFLVAGGGRLVVGVDPSLSGLTVREYDYQDYDYFLTSATGFWGSLAWTYDRIGNRLTETDGGITDIYSYTPNGTGGSTALLASITLGVGGTRSFAHTPAGHQTQVNSAGNVIDFTFDDAGRMAQADRATHTAAFLYDGRSFLRQAGNAATSGTTTPTYDSAGLVHSLLRQPPGGGDPTRHVVFYLAGRPVAQVALETGQPDRWQYLTTDHLGTPLLATDVTGAKLWHNQLAPFGEDTRAGTAEGALENEVFLRFPGQWEDTTWQEAMLGAKKYYNVWRWYQPATGRYTRADPLGLEGSGPNVYLYARSNPLMYLDLDGRKVVFENFPNGKQDDAEQAINQIKEQLDNNPCCVEGDRAEEILGLIKSTERTVKLKYRPDAKHCGFTPFTSLIGINNTIRIGPGAWNCCRSGAVDEVTSLASTILHELHHYLFRTTEGPAYEAEKNCFGCQGP